MPKAQVRQMRLDLEGRDLWEQLPEDVRRRCVQLWSLLLREVVREPMLARGKDNEREDHGKPS